MGAAPAGGNVGNTLTAQTIFFSDQLVPNLKGNTNAFMAAAHKRIQPMHSGINTVLFQYDELGADINQVSDGTIGNPEFVGTVSVPAQIGEWNNFCNFSKFVVAASIDDNVGNSAIELGYQAAQTQSELMSSTADSASTVDTQVNQSGLLSSPYTATLPVLRELKQQLVSIGVLPCKNQKFCGAISPNILGDLWNGSTVNASAVDFWKYTDEGQGKFEKMAGATTQDVGIELPGTGIVFYQTPFVTKTANYQSTGDYAYRTYVFGEYGIINVWLGVPGDTDLGENDWRTIECHVTTNYQPSSYDPTGTIGASAAYIFHQTTFLPAAPAASNTQRLRFLDSVPAIQ